MHVRGTNWNLVGLECMVSWKEVLREGIWEKTWANQKVSPEGPRCQQRKAEASFLGSRDLRKISEEVSKEGRSKCARCTLPAVSWGRGQCSLFQGPCRQWRIAKARGLVPTG